MAALTADRDTPIFLDGEIVQYPMAAAVKIFQGSLVMIDAGYAKPGAVPAGTIGASGVAEEFKDNTAGAAGDVLINIRRCVGKFAHTGLVQGDIGKWLKNSDDQTVVLTASGTDRIGRLHHIEGASAWVDTRPYPI